MLNYLISALFGAKLRNETSQMDESDVEITGEGQARLEGIMFFCGTLKRNFYIANDSRLELYVSPFNKQNPYFKFKCVCGEKHRIEIKETWEV